VKSNEMLNSALLGDKGSNARMTGIPLSRGAKLVRGRHDVGVASRT
jgi:hypothetical protein